MKIRGFRGNQATFRAVRFEEGAGLAGRGGDPGAYPNEG